MHSDKFPPPRGTFANSSMRDALRHCANLIFRNGRPSRRTGDIFPCKFPIRGMMQARVIDGRDAGICSMETTRLRDRQPSSDGGRDGERRLRSGPHRGEAFAVFSWYIFPIHPRRLFRKIKRRCFAATNVPRNNMRVPGWCNAGCWKKKQKIKASAFQRVKRAR